VFDNVEEINPATRKNADAFMENAKTTQPRMELISQRR